MCSWIGRINTVKMSILPKAIYRFGAIPIKIPMVFFTDIVQTILNFIRNHKTSQIIKANTAGGITLPDFKLYCKSIVTKQYCIGIKIDTQINGTEINPCIYSQLIYIIVAKNIQCEKDNLFNKGGWETWTGTCKRTELDHYLTPYTKIS